MFYFIAYSCSQHFPNPWLLLVVMLVLLLVIIVIIIIIMMMMMMLMVMMVVSSKAIEISRVVRDWFLKSKEPTERHFDWFRNHRKSP